jgi:hypothetical protein
MSYPRPIFEGVFGGSPGFGPVCAPTLETKKNFLVSFLDAQTGKPGEDLPPNIEINKEKYV